MKKLAVLFFFVLNSHSYSQNIIKGKIINIHKENIGNASITIEDRVMTVYWRFQLLIKI